MTRQVTSSWQSGGSSSPGGSGMSVPVPGSLLQRIHLPWRHPSILFRGRRLGPCRGTGSLTLKTTRLSSPRTLLPLQKKALNETQKYDINLQVVRMYALPRIIKGSGWAKERGCCHCKWILCSKEPGTGTDIPLPPGDELPPNCHDDVTLQKAFSSRYRINISHFYQEEGVHSLPLQGEVSRTLASASFLVSMSYYWLVDSRLESLADIMSNKKRRK
jgi:hypothetical protein